MGSMSMKFTHHTIFVTDQEEAKAFYVDKLGFDVEYRRRDGRLSLADRLAEGATRF